MKKSFAVVAMIAAVLFMVPSVQAVSASERNVGGQVPAFVRNALRNAPEDALVAVGTARMATVGMSRTIAQTRARADLSRQLDSIVRDMVTDYMATSETDPSLAVSFQESITVILSESRIQGARTVDEDIAPNGQYWVVLMLSRSSTAQEIAAATEIASNMFPGFEHAMNAVHRMDSAMGRNNQVPIVVADS